MYDINEMNRYAASLGYKTYLGDYTTTEARPPQEIDKDTEELLLIKEAYTVGDMSGNPIWVTEICRFGK